MITPSILREIAAKKKERLIQDKARIAPAQMIVLSEKASARPSFKDALQKDGLSIIGEIKKASPSKGLIRGDFDPVTLSLEYAGCVDALSVLTEQDYFLGSPEYLTAAANAVPLPVLRKDFILDEYQIYEAKAIGASAVLLIAAMLDKKELSEFIALTKSIGLDALIEAHSTEEAETALNAGAEIIGINNRDLNTFHVDLETTNAIAKMIPPGKILISESGFHSADDIRRIKSSKIDAILVGESFMKCADIAAKAKEFKHAYAD